MSEKHIPRVESHTSHEKVVSHEHHEKARQHQAEQANRARQEKSNENLSKIKELARAEAKTTQKITQHEQPAQESADMVGVQHSLKANAYQRTLAKTQQKLSKPSRTFSKVIHHPVVDRVSNVGAQTIARPSGFLSGSICAFLGSLVVYYFAKHYGFEYNFLLLIFFFVGGYLLGTLLELLIWAVYSRKQHYKS